MSMFGNDRKDSLYNDIVEFIQEYSLSEFFDILESVSEYHLDYKLKNEGDNE